MPAMEDTYVRFEPNPLKIQAWRARLVADHDDAEPTTTTTTSPAELYARAVPTLLRWKDRLVASARWREVRATGAAVAAPGILCVLEGLAPASPAAGDDDPTTSGSSAVWSASLSGGGGGSGGGASFFESVRGAGAGARVDESAAADHRAAPAPGAPSPLPPPPLSAGGAVLALPAELSAFIEYRTQLEDIFQDPLLFYPYLDRTHELVLEAFDDATPTHDRDFSPASAAAAASSSTLTDIFYLLQLLIPGMLLIVHDTLTFPTTSKAAAAERNSRPSSQSQQQQQQQQQQQRAHGRSSTMVFDMGNDTPSPSPSPSPKEFTRSGSTGSGSRRVTLTRTRRGVPPAQWIRSNAPLLEDIFGQVCLRAFHECAEDRARANWTTVYVAAAAARSGRRGADLEFSQIEDDVSPGSSKTRQKGAALCRDVYFDSTGRARTL